MNNQTDEGNEEDTISFSALANESEKEFRLQSLGFGFLTGLSIYCLANDYNFGAALCAGLGVMKGLFGLQEAKKEILYRYLDATQPEPAPIKPQKEKTQSASFENLTK